MNSAAFLHKKPNFIVPDVLVKKMLVSHPTSFGFAGRIGDELKFEVLPKAIKFEEVTELQKAFEKDDLLLYFTNFPKAVVGDDTMPWIMNDKAGNPILAIMYEGKAKNYEGLNGDHTGEYCASEEIVFPRLLKALEASDSDVGKLIAELNKPGLQSALKSIFDDRGAYALLPRTGPPIIFGDAKIGGEFGWGYASNAHDYKEEAPKSEKAKEVATSALTFLRGAGSSATAAPAPEKPVEDPKPDVAAPAETPAVSVPQIDPAKELEAKGYARIFPPPKLGKGGARNLWLRTFNCIPDAEGKFGQLPADHQSAQCAVWVQPELIDLSKRTANNQKEVQSLATSVHKFRQKQPALGVGPVSHPVKTETEKNAEVVATLARDELLSKDKGGEKPVTRSSVREAYVPSTSGVGTMSDANKEKAMLRLAGYLDKDRPRPSPLELQKREQVHANFSESTSTTFEERLFLPKEQIHDLFDGNEIAVAMYQELKWRYIQDSGVKLEDLVTPKSYPDQKADPETTKEEVVAPQPQPEPKKNVGALSFLRGAA